MDGIDKEVGIGPRSLTRPISPPRKRQKTDNERHARPDPLLKNEQGSTESGPASETASEPDVDSGSRGAEQARSKMPSPAIFSSPFRLTHIRDLGEEDNVDTLSLNDIIGDPLIAECWDFNYLHDIEFLLDALDQDVRDLVRVHVVHGFWKKDDPNRILLQDDAEKHKNVVLHTAFLPEIFGTHHSKMLVLLRHDDTAQVVIHTANMIPKDWTNMTNRIWLSPRLPLLQSQDPANGCEYESLTEGTGVKFKVDLLNYLKAYDDKRVVCRDLVTNLEKYDFSSIRGTLIASVPGRHDFTDLSTSAWGWAAIRRALRSVPLQVGKSEVVVQVSSIATLGPTDTWLQRTLFDSMCRGKAAVVTPRPQFKIMFPTADEIRRSLDGYGSGGSIHTKIQSSQQAKQLIYQKHLLCHWANDSPHGKDLDQNVSILDAGRNRAAPHIKTYIRYGANSIDWALLSSANLSKQAWGDATGAGGQTRISSWEIGVLVWPELFAKDALMTAVVKRDTPSTETTNPGLGRPVVGLRSPYSMPVQRYGQGEAPWVATLSYPEPDWAGNTW
ncbi:uncharacterized protein PgNI_01686 [Pyricularia grisea]|uniref:PLD phosphodiesterase domain-containing protein n=1 Tax=Pyricularia grisea TaxID=148305 RepID=A0A6P8BH54_PYRGI|nr:uncharacterized protein PgNI_01686 [Pyricularia grisea]TLD16206.1 hypothetical protein PgNI_01686 [Pyricularia grisea]